MIKFYNGNMVEYEILPLVDYYDDVLRRPTQLWDFQNKSFTETQYLAFTLTESLQHYKGLGLSANQLGLPHRVCAINMGDKIWVMFNPQIIEFSGSPSEYSEGCLSYPGLYLKLDRPNHIKVKFQALGGEEIQQEFDGLTSVCVQHELDHLDGIVYTSKVSPIKVDRAKRKVKKNLKKIRQISNVA